MTKTKLNSLNLRLQVQLAELATCTTDAQGSVNVDLQCTDSTCTLDAGGSTNVAMSCTDGTCELHCMDASNCSMDCIGTSSCRLDCMGAMSCGFDTCASPVICGGGVMVCNRACP